MRWQTLKLAAVALLGIGVGAMGYVNLYASPRRALMRDITSLERGIAQFEDAVRLRNGDRARLEAIGATTLGGTQAEVEHRFRTSLGEIGRHCGLEQVVPNSGEARAMMSPASQATSRIGGDFGRLLKQDPDFLVVQGSLTGVGTLEEVLETLATVQAQAWAHRVGSVSIHPLGDDRASFELRIDAIATMMMPDLVREDAEGPSWSPVRARERNAWAGVATKNVFRRVPEPEPVQAVEATLPEPPASPAYDQWQLTALPGGTSGVLAGLVNVRTGEQLFLEVGDSVLDAQLADVDRFSAVFELSGTRCEVQIGQTLAERREIP